ncbi:hypothetical protein Tco_1176360 [Tanacetum coccineum]
MGATCVCFTPDGGIYGLRFDVVWLFCISPESRTKANGNAGLMLIEHEMIMYDLSFKLWDGDGNKCSVEALMSLHGFHKDETICILAGRPIMVAAMADASSLICLLHPDQKLFRSMSSISLLPQYMLSELCFDTSVSREGEKHQERERERGWRMRKSEPAMVRKKKKELWAYGEAFGKQNVSNRTTVVVWKGALFMEADLSGWDLRATTNGKGKRKLDDINECLLLHDLVSKKQCINEVDVGTNNDHSLCRLVNSAYGNKDVSSTFMNNNDDVELSTPVMDLSPHRVDTGCSRFNRKEHVPTLVAKDRSGNFILTVSLYQSEDVLNYFHINLEFEGSDILNLSRIEKVAQLEDVFIQGIKPLSMLEALEKSGRQQRYIKRFRYLFDSKVKHVPYSDFINKKLIAQMVLSF